MTEYVLGFYFLDPFVLLIRKNRPDWQAGKLNGIGGHIEPGESPHDAMVREFREEAGSQTDGWTKFAEMNFPDVRVHCFTLRGGADNIHTMTDEMIGFYDFSTLVNVLSNVPWLIAMARSHKPGQQFFFEITEIPC